LHYALTLTCAATALRASEILALRWDDVLWSEGRISEESTAELLGEGEPLQATDWNLLAALAPEEAQR